MEGTRPCKAHGCVGGAGHRCAWHIRSWESRRSPPRNSRSRPFCRRPTRSWRSTSRLGKDLAADSKGDLTLKVYPGGTLGAGPFQQYKRAVEGIADIADICHPFHSKVFAKTMLIVLPGSATSAVDATTRLWNLPEAHAGERLQGGEERLHVLRCRRRCLPRATSRCARSPTSRASRCSRRARPSRPIVAAWGALSGANGPERDVQRAFDRRGRHGGTARRPSLMPPFRLAEISKYTSVGVSGLFNPCGGDHEQGELCGVDTVAEGDLRQAHRQGDEPESREDLRRLVATSRSRWQATAKRWR